MQNIRIETAAHYGTVVRHSPKITVQTGQRVWGQEFSVGFQTYGKKEWQQLRKFPLVGVTFCHLALGDGAHGRTFAVLPHIVLPFVQQKKWGAGLRVGAGFGHVSRPYNSFSNPNQNAIGSHFNGSAQLRLAAHVLLSKQWAAQAGLCITHFSNGSKALPNYGINAPSAVLAFVWSPKNPTPTIAENPSKIAQKPRWGGVAHTGVGLVEYIVIDGPTYPVWTASAGAYYMLNRVNRLTVGLDYEFNRSLYEWGLHTTIFQDADIARKSSTRLAPFVSDEFLFGDVSLLLHVGFYQGRGFNQYVLTSYYQKLGVRYYFPKLLGSRLRPHVGVYLKAHKAIAEYISYNVGFMF